MQKKYLKLIFQTKKLFVNVILALVFTAFCQTASSASRIKDIVSFEGVRDNMLIGYGLVVGLNGSGDSLSNSPFTKQSLQGMLERLGVNIRGNDLNTKNVAAVVVSANLPPFARQGSRIDVTVSTLGDAESLMGGTLLVTPLIGADGQVYAVGQGPVLVGGFEIQGDAASIVKGVPTAGRVPGGAIVELEIGFEMGNLKELRLAMRNPDLTTARRIANSINKYLGSEAAKVTDPGTIFLKAPNNYKKDMVSLLTDLEQLKIETDQSAKIVIDEATGVIVLGNHVKVNTVAIALGTLSISVTETPQVSQPQPFSETGETVEVPRTTIEVSEEDKKLAVVKESVNLQDLVNGLNSLGISPRDMISILQALKTAGALQAEIKLM